jgi:hypothetical protein
LKIRRHEEIILAPSELRQVLLMVIDVGAKADDVSEHTASTGGVSSDDGRGRLDRSTIRDNDHHFDRLGGA